MNTHPQHDEIVAAIKAMPLWNDPQTFRQSEISNCYEDSELIESFGWEGEKALTPAQAVKAVKALCDLRDDVFGEMDRLEEAEARRNDEESLRNFIELCEYEQWYREANG
jgi:hypothetical protein